VVDTTKRNSPCPVKYTRHLHVLTNFNIYVVMIKEVGNEDVEMVSNIILIFPQKKNIILMFVKQFYSDGLNILSLALF